MRVAYYSPLPPERSGIADYSALLLPAIRRRLDVAVVPRRRARPPRGADLCVYHVGNDPEAHGWIVDALGRRSGVVVLHEFVLHHLVAGLTLARRDVAGYLSALGREAGLVGRLLGLGVVDGCIPPLWESRPEDFPLATLVLERAGDHGVIVHSRYTEARVRETGYAGPVWRIPHPSWPVGDIARAELPAGRYVGCLGHLNATKRIPQLLEAFVLVRESHPDTRLLLIGATGPRLDLEGEIERAGLPEGAVVREGYVDERRFWSLMAACDVCVSLRAPTMGETSGSAIRALSLGRPLVVSDLGWFAELPDDVALKVPVEEGEVARLTAALELLLSREDVARAVGEAGRAYVAREHGVERVADLYADALEVAAGGDAVRRAVADEIGRAAAEIGIAAGTPEAAELATRLAGARIGE